MAKANRARWAFIAVCAGLGGYPSAADAAILLKTFMFAVCVTGAKHPDACKNSGADGSVVVSDEAMEGLDGRIGQAASIVALPPKGAVPRSNDQARHQRHREDASSPKPQ